MLAGGLGPDSNLGCVAPAWGTAHAEREVGQSGGRPPPHASDLERKVAVDSLGSRLSVPLKRRVAREGGMDVLTSAVSVLWSRSLRIVAHVEEKDVASGTGRYIIMTLT